MSEINVSYADLLRMQGMILDLSALVDQMLGEVQPPPTLVDPRSPNTTHHDPPPGQGGDVRAVHLTVHELTGLIRQYRCVAVELLPDDDSCNIYVEVVGKTGVPVFADVRMGTGYSGNPSSFDQYIPPGNPQNNFFMGHQSGFNPPNLGPLAMMVLDRGTIVSDVVGGLGLSRGQHMSYRIRFMHV